MLKKIVLTALLALGVAAVTAVADTPIPPLPGSRLHRGTGAITLRRKPVLDSGVDQLKSRVDALAFAF